MELSEVKLTYMQEPDSCDDRNELDVQILEVVVTDAGGGKYFYIKTDRWAFDSIKDMTAQFNRISQALKELGVDLAGDQATNRS